MSANLVVDVGATCQNETSVNVFGSPASGVFVGEIIDMMHSDTFCNIFVQGGGNSGVTQSGVVGVIVQFSDGLTSGSFTDPTSGQTSFLPSFISSGGTFFVNSGLAVSGGLPIGARVDGAPPFCSGGIAFGAVLRNGRYGRLILRSGTSLVSPITAGFVTNLRTTGSGGGQSQSPGSGNVSV